MIRITVTKTGLVTRDVTKNFLIKSTPTEIVEEEHSNYGGNKRKVQNIEEYQVQTVPETTSYSVELLDQNIEDDAKFDLASVIRAVNGL